MVWQLFLSIFLLIIIFLITKNLVNIIYALIQSVFKNKNTAVWILALFFLPGTVIHELSHLILALFLRVPTGPISIFPEIVGDNKRGQSPFGDSPLTAVPIRMGHLMIAKTDPIRLTLIGVAPMIVGLVIIYFVGNIFWGQSPFGDSPQLSSRSGTVPLIVLGIYLLFITSATMFSSRQDLKSLFITLPFTIIIFTAFYFSGIKISWGQSPFVASPLVEKITNFISNLNKSLILTAGIDYIVLFILAVGTMFLGKSHHNLIKK